MTTSVRHPDWSICYASEAERLSAQRHWQDITDALTREGVLTNENLHAIERCVHFRIVYEKAHSQIAREGITNKPKRGNSRAIERKNPAFEIMRETAVTLNSIESELGLSPKSRGYAPPSNQVKQGSRPFDKFAPKSG